MSYQIKTDNYRNELPGIYRHIFIGMSYQVSPLWKQQRQRKTSEQLSEGRSPEYRVHVSLVKIILLVLIIDFLCVLTDWVVGRTSRISCVFRLAESLRALKAGFIHAWQTNNQVAIPFVHWQEYSTRKVLRISYFWPDWNSYVRLGVFRHTIFNSMRSHSYFFLKIKNSNCCLWDS